MTPGTVARVARLQEEIDKRGILNMAFFKDETWNNLSAEDRAISICEVLEVVFFEPERLTVAKEYCKDSVRFPNHAIHPEMN